MGEVDVEDRLTGHSSVYQLMALRVAIVARFNDDDNSWSRAQLDLEAHLSAWAASTSLPAGLTEDYRRAFRACLKSHAPSNIRSG